MTTRYTPLLLFLACMTAAQNLTNITISVPSGTTNHGDPHVLCLPAGIIDFLIFYFGNYIAHAATVVTYHGESTSSILTTMMIALFFPTAGIWKALNAIAGCPRIKIWNARLQGSKMTALDCAVLAGALCMVVRSQDWTARKGEYISQAFFLSSNPRKSNLMNYPSTENHNGEESHATIPLNGVTVAGSSGYRRIMNEAEPRISDNIADQLASVELHEMTNSQSQRPYSDAHANDPKVAKSRYTVAQTPWDRDFGPLSSFLDSTLSSGFEGSGLKGRKIHGTRTLPAGYEFHFVPRDATIRPYEDPQSSFGLFDGFSHSYDGPKALLAIIQTIFAATTLYRTRGNQIEQYGYASFGLTVTPYVVMSIVNLLGNALTLNYNAIYFVRSEIMLEAELRGGRFDGVIGELIPDDVDKPFSDVLTSGVFDVIHNEDIPRDLSTGLVFRPFRKNLCTTQEGKSLPADKTGPFLRLKKYSTEFVSVSYSVSEFSGFSDYLAIPSCPTFKRLKGVPLESKSAWHGRDNVIRILFRLLVVIMLLAPYIIIGVLSKFYKGSSTTAQRVWTMFWLVAGTFFGFVARLSLEDDLWNAGASILCLCFGAPVIGGLIVVGQMIAQFGVCTRIS